MAKIGCKRLLFCGNAEGSVAVKLGALVSADLSINTAEASLYGDDVRQEYVNEFINATLTCDITDLTPENESKLLGSTISSSELIDKASDSAPEGKVGYYRAIMVGGVKKYEGVYFERAKASITSESDSTKGESISFGTTSISFSISADATTENWRHRERFDTESACKTWLDTAIGYSGT